MCKAWALAPEITHNAFQHEDVVCVVSTYDVKFDNLLANKAKPATYLISRAACVQSPPAFACHFTKHMVNGRISRLYGQRSRRTSKEQLVQKLLIGRLMLSLA